MIDVTRRDFLKGAVGLLGTSAFMPKREPVWELEEPVIKGESVIDSELSADRQEIEADLSRVRLKINDKLIPGIVKANLCIDHPTDLSALPFARLECWWIGYPDSFCKIHGYYESAESLDLKLPIPDEGARVQTTMRIGEYTISWPTTRGLRGTFKPKTLREFHKFMEVYIVFIGSEPVIYLQPC